MAGVETAPPNVPDWPKPASSIRTTRTFGAPSGAFGLLRMFQSGRDPASVRLTTPPKTGRRSGRIERSTWSATMTPSLLGWDGAHCLPRPLTPHHPDRVTQSDGCERYAAGTAAAHPARHGADAPAARSTPRLAFILKRSGDDPGVAS